MKESTKEILIFLVTGIVAVLLFSGYKILAIFDLTMN